MQELPVNAIRQGFDSFFRNEHSRLIAIAISLLGDERQAEDLAQEALLRAYRDWDRISRYEQPGAWVRRVMLNLISSTGRSRRRERQALARLQTVPGATHDRATTEAADSEQFWAAVRALPRRQAEVVALYYVEDLSVSEVASVLDCAEGTVKSHLHRSRSALAVSLRSFIEEDQP